MPLVLSQRGHCMIYVFFYQQTRNGRVKIAAERADECEEHYRLASGFPRSTKAILVGPSENTPAN
jgi:hypothetical protein